MTQAQPESNSVDRGTLSRRPASTLSSVASTSCESLDTPVLRQIKGFGYAITAVIAVLSA